MMGATVDQTDQDLYTDKPAHLVFLSPFYIAETEVTNQLWQRLMPERESLLPKGYPTNPVSYVSWHDAQEFVHRLDSITGLSFRLPTEAEWEFAARGGIKSKHYRFAGGNEPDSVGWTNNCSGNWSHPVARKKPNELGLYDMTGNASEWCEDNYAPYEIGTPPDPCVRDTGRYKIVRGGSYDECIANSHISVRRWYLPETSHGYIGFRLALTLPNEPTMQTVKSEPDLTRKIRLHGRKLLFTYIPAEEPYYISEEISVSLWRKMMRKDPPDNFKQIALGMTRTERTLFAEYCSRDAKEVLLVASAEHIVAAEQKHLIEPFNPEQNHKRRQPTVRQIQHRRKAAAKLSPWAELAGFRLPQPDDPVLLQYKNDDGDSKPLRLVIKI